MKQAEVKIGGEYLVKVGTRLARVTVEAAISGRGRQRYQCRTHDTGRPIKATAARLRPAPAAPQTPLRAAIDRMVTAAEDRGLVILGGPDAPAIDLACELAAWSACPVGAY